MARTILSILTMGGLVAWPAVAQTPAPPPLEEFVTEVVRSWAAGDAGAIVALAPADGRIRLDLDGRGADSLRRRHATAALRSLFGAWETRAARPRAATVAGGTPLRAFAELSWRAALRGTREVRERIVFVGLVAEGGEWRVQEVRIVEAP